MGYLLVGTIAILLLILSRINYTNTSICNDNSKNVTSIKFDIKYIILFRIAYYCDYTMTYTLIIKDKNGILSYELSHNVADTPLTSVHINEYKRTKYIYDNLLNAFSGKVCLIESKEAREKYIRDFIYIYNGKLLTI